MEAMQSVDVAHFVCLEITGDETLSGLPVVERDAYLVVARRQRTDVNFPAQWDVVARADAGISLGDALRRYASR